MDAIQLSPYHDIADYAARFARDGHVHIANILREDDARRLHEALAFRTPWRLMLIHDGPTELTQEQWAAMPREQRDQIDRDIMAAGKERFEGRFLNLRFSDDGELYDGQPAELAALSRFLNGDFLAFARAVTARSQIELADAQATLYRPGDFLHIHDDIFAEKKRLAAYVLNLTPRWKPEWGGLLGFVDSDDHVKHAYTPSWNALNILAVPQRHFVSMVAPFGTEGRYSVTGWLRRR
jgi:Rps23 Pro-64 3,4-dihydroxylase Tpa1-like proline 4-hydroxylase